MDLSFVNGSADGYLDVQIHEIDIATSESIWKWSALDHIPLNASQLPLTDMAAYESVAWDYVYNNSVSPDEILVLSQKKLPLAGNTTLASPISKKTSPCSPTLATTTTPVPPGEMLKTPHPPVRHEFYLEHPASKTYSPLSLNTYNESTSLFSDSWSSSHYLPNHQNATSRFMSYGQLPILREWQAGPGLNQTAFKWQATFGADNEVATYQAQKASWYGEPKTAPQLLVLQNGTAYMSWNGATHVAGWNIYSGSADNDTTYTLKGIARSRGFETAVDLGAGCYMVQLLMDFSPSANATYGINSTRACSS
ncbi:hypothetical protein BPOR_0111g00060 [Botrytis porri]|uniref:Uncharacterized protein n=1 Tax=Botrytis porri TaxID=87229 RepID=A0A4Z1KY52_9HELO|nr:hypothetical protein BPOR_0111g00060 [Botrytis porri]